VKAFDNRTRADHAYLAAHDQCWWLTEYLSGRRLQPGSTSRLILSLKSEPSRIAFDPRRARDRRQAVRAIAELLRSAVAREWAEQATWIPIPPARVSFDIGQDHRLLPVLRTAFSGYDVDVRTILTLRDGAIPDHVQPRRSSPEALYGRLQINWHLLCARPLRDRLVLFDDVVTTGKHYRCCEQRLRSALPQAVVTGLFVARRVLSGRACRAP
jgi:predicted amidophosphoribosyltransferase